MPFVVYHTIIEGCIPYQLGLPFRNDLYCLNMLEKVQDTQCMQGSC